MTSKYDVIIVGGGHNGLVAATYLARGGRRVLVLERRPLVGGACVTEETFPGFKVSTASYVNSLFRPQIIRELELAKHGLEILERSPSSFTPMKDGRSLFFWPDAQKTIDSIAQFSRKDAEAFPKYEAMLERIADTIEPTLDMPPPDPSDTSLGNLWTLLKFAMRMRPLTGQLDDVMRLFMAPARTVLEDWFESDELRATLATDAVIGAWASPGTPGTGYVLFHHVMGETNGKRGVWGYVRGGMGALSEALASSARAAGVEILTDAPVAEIRVESGEVRGVALENGDSYDAPVVASNLDCYQTFERLMNPNHLPDDFRKKIKKIRYDSGSCKINVALSELPDFRAIPGTESAPHHRGTIHIAPNLDDMDRGFFEATQGKTSTAPVIECTIPSTVDETLAPEGKHIMGIFTQYTPYELSEGSWDTERDIFADRVFDIINEYAPNFRDSVIDRQVLAPPDLESMLGLTGGNIFQGAMTLEQLFFMRPALGYADHYTPIKGLFLCGAASHPGGGVMGACGRNAALVMLKD